MDCQNLIKTAKKLEDRQNPDLAKDETLQEDQAKVGKLSRDLENDSAVEDQFDNMPV